MRHIKFLLFSILFWFVLGAFTPAATAQTLEETKVFTEADFLTWVKSNHPLMLRAELLGPKGDAVLLEAKGGFDPKLYGQYDDKNFDDKNYFRQGEGGLKIPLWFGGEVKLGYSLSNGVFLNPADNLPDNGQLIVGVEIPLGRGLFFDERRAQIKQAKIYQGANESERQKMINDFLIKAIKNYWNWAYCYQLKSIYEEALVLAEIRFDNIKTSFLQGDKPAMDTLESVIQVQNRQLQLQQASLDYQKSRLALSNFLWYKDLIPLEVTDVLRPEVVATQPYTRSTPFNMDSIINQHPELQIIQTKQLTLDIKERLKREDFKPQFFVNYNFLGDGLNLAAENNETSDWNRLVNENYKWGVRATYPILLRKARGGLQRIQLEQKDTEFKLKTKVVQIKNKAKAILRSIDNTRQQLRIQEKTVEDYASLLQAEKEKFRIGESSIFLLNNREQKLIEARMKLLKQQTKYQTLVKELDWAMGRLE